MYILPGFEGSAHDARLWEFATRKDMKIPKWRWLLGDSVFPLCDEVVTPYIGVRYHLQEWFRWKENKGLVMIYWLLWCSVSIASNNVFFSLHADLTINWFKTMPSYSI